MNSLFTYLRTVSPRRKKVAAAILVVAVIGGIYGLRGGSTSVGQEIRVTRGDIAETVSVTGSVKAVDDVSLSFQNGGRIARVDAKVGDHVKAGQLIASLNSAELAAQLRDAQANVIAQQARLDELLKGARQEDLAIKESELSKAQFDVKNARGNAYDVLADALTRADNAMNVQLEGVFTETGSTDYPSYKLSFSCFCNQLDITVGGQRSLVEQGLRSWQRDMSVLAADTAPEVLMADIRQAREYLQTARTMLENLSAVLNDPTVSLPSETAAAYRASASAARTVIIATQVSVASQEQAITTYQLALDRVNGELSKLRNGSTPETIAVQRAQLLSALAQADRISALISKNAIVSPISGILTKMDAKVGQNAAPNVDLVSIISDQQLELEANLPEVDIGKINIGNPVKVTVDALPGELLTASVSFIEPGETVVDGVVNFKVTMTLSAPDLRLKSGLTVNLDIQSKHHEGVLILPQYAVSEESDGSFVQRIVGNATEKVPVSLGIRSQDGNLEILSGVSEGDVVKNIGLKTP